MRDGSGGAPFLSVRVAYMTGRTFRGQPMRDVHPVETQGRDLVFAAGARRGIAFETTYWDEPDLPMRFDAAIIRTCWDYHERAEEFAATIEQFERGGLRVYNPSAAVRWNARKTYLQQLGPAAIETIWAERADAHTVAKAFDALDSAEVIVKPQVGAGASEVIRLKRNAWSEADLIAGPRGAAMVQPYLRSIETEGERSLIWFGGRLSHAIRKIPAAGEWLANMPGRTRFLAESAPPAAIAAAEAALAHAPPDLLYVRIDVVLGDDGGWRVLEIEAIEPYLFLDLAPESADVFAAAIARVLGV